MSQATLGGVYRNSNLFSNYYLEEKVYGLDAWDCDEAGGTAGFRDNATSTISALDRLEALTLPALADVPTRTASRSSAPRNWTNRSSARTS